MCIRDRGGGSVICGTHYIHQTRKLGSNSNTNQIPVVIFSWQFSKTCFIYKIFRIFIVVIMKYILIYMPSLRLNSFTWPNDEFAEKLARMGSSAVSYTHLRAHETSLHLVCRLLLEKSRHSEEDVAERCGPPRPYLFFNDTATTEIYTLHIVGSVRCV